MKNYILILLLGFVCTASIFAQKDEFEYGMASYYSDKYQGSPTASGEEYDRNKMTAAHKTLPFGTMIKVTRLDNKKSVRVRVNDRGPYIKDRVVDISRAAAVELGMIKEGQTKVKVEIVKGPSAAEPVATKSKPSVPKEASTETAAITAPKNTATNKAEPKKTTAKSEPAPSRKTDAKSSSKASTSKKVAEKSTKNAAKMTLVKGKDFQPYDLYKIELLRPEKKGFGVQVASFNHYESVFKQIAELQGEWFKNIMLSVEKGNEGTPIYKIILGPFDDEKTAQAYKSNLKKKKINGFVVNLETIDY